MSGVRRALGRLYERILRLYPDDALGPGTGPALATSRDAYRSTAVESGEAAALGQALRHLWKAAAAIPAAWYVHSRRRNGPDDRLTKRTGAAPEYHVRQALKGLRRSPGYALAFVVTFGLAVGVNSAVFSVVNGVLLEPLPFDDGDRILYLKQPARAAGVENTSFSFMEVDDYRARSSTVSEFVEYGDWEFTHATIAAHYVRAVEGDLSDCTVVQKIGAGVLPVGVSRIGSDYRIEVTQGAVEIDEPLADERATAIAAALGLRPEDLDERCPIQVVSTGHSKVLIGIRSPDTLHGLRPDLSALTELSDEIGCNDYYVFTLTPDDDHLAHGRMFAPAIGITEDPVTGNANGPLGAYLIHHRLADCDDHGVLASRARQGEAMGRPGTAEVSVEMDDDGQPTTVRVAGRAVIVFRAEVLSTNAS